MGKWRIISVAFLLILLLLVPLLILFFLFWHGLPSNITELWSKNRTTFIVNILSSIAYTILLSILVLLRKKIFRFGQTVLNSRSKEERIEQERDYLENLKDNFTRKWKIDKYIDLEVILDDLGQVAYRVPSRPWGQSYTQEALAESSRGSRVNVRQFLRDEKEKRIMLKGDPGTGKTLTLQRFAVDVARESLKKLSATPNVKLPLYIPLNLYTGKSEEGKPEPVLDFLQRYLQVEYPGATFLHSELTDYLWKGRIILLFDGLNELPLDEYAIRYDNLEKFIDLYGKTKVIFTCRTLRETRPSYKTVALSELDKEQMKRFIMAYLGQKDPRSADDLCRVIDSPDSSLLRFSRNPFMLHKLVCSDTGFTPTANRPFLAQLFDHYIHGQLSKYTEDVERTTLLLSDIAFAMQRAGKFAGVVEYEWLQTQFPDKPLESYLKNAQKAELVDYTQGRDFRFYHQILQEYFAAVALGDEWNEKHSFVEYISDYRWEETLLVCASIVKDTEQFISEIWSPGNRSLEALWLAIKAVGRSSGPGYISEKYYNALMAEVENNLGLTNDFSVVGDSRTVRIVDTIKALSYVEDEQATHLLIAALKKYDGWIRELCIKILGGPKFEFAREQLREAVLQLYSFRDLLRLAPFMNRREWLSLVLKSTISIDLWINAFYFLWRWLQILVPALFFGLIIAVSGLFKVDPIVFIGRVIALTIIFKPTVDYISSVYKIFHSEDSKPTKLKRVVNLFGWGDLFLFAFVITLWFFAGDIFLIFGLILYVYLCIWSVMLIISFIRNLKNLPHQARFLYEPYQGRMAMFMTLVGIAILTLEVFFPSSQQSPSLHHVSSGLEPILSTIGAFPYLIFILFLPFIAIIGVASIVVHSFTYIIYWRLHRYRVTYMRRGEEKALQRLMKIALKPSSWFQIRKRAIRELRSVDLPSHYIENLENLSENENDPELLKELQHTVYDLYKRILERERGTPTGIYASALAKKEEAQRQEALAVFRQGEYYRLDKRYQDALIKYDQAIAIDEKCALAITRRGEVFRELGRYQEALTDFNRSVALNDRYISAIAGRGMTHRLMGHLQDALTDINRAISLDDKRPWIIAERGEIYRQMGQYQKALKDFDRTISLVKKYVLAYRYRGMTYRQMEKYRKALKDFNTSISLDKYDAYNFANRGYTYLKVREYQKALKDFDHALSLNDKERWYWYNRALILLLLGKNNASDQDFQTAIELAQAELQSKPEDQSIRFDIALYALVSGNEIEAETQYTAIALSCLVPEGIEHAITALEDFLMARPSHEPTQRIIAQLQARIAQLKQSFDK